MVAPLSSCTTMEYTSYLQRTASQSADITPNKTSADSVNISNEGKSASLLSGLRGAMGLIPDSSGAVRVESIQECYEKDTEAIEQEMRALYQRLGISSNTEMSISIGNDGKAVVSGESPEAEALAEAINSDPQLLNTMRRASANASLLAAIEDAEEFQAAYKANPSAALERYGYLLNDNSSHDTTFAMKNGNFHVDVDRKFSFRS